MVIVFVSCVRVTVQVSLAFSSALLAEVAPDGAGTEGDGTDGGDTDGVDAEDPEGLDESDDEDDEELSARAALKKSTSGTT
ncbi:MAG: hypothetical protein COB08_004850 [Rhodobacteraceae bacterium]|nr:hypothetical protein [Paracoccaceae bacterium]